MLMRKLIILFHFEVKCKYNIKVNKLIEINISLSI